MTMTFGWLSEALFFFHAATQDTSPLPSSLPT